MSTRSSLREVLARPEGIGARPRESSAFPVRLILTADKIQQPVEVARLLARHGMSLRKAHDALNRLADRESVAAELHARDRGKLLSALSALGVRAQVIQVPEADVRAVRERFGLSQAEFAIRFGLELDTVQNWEQGRHRPDPPTQLLIKVIELHPEIVEAVLAGKAAR
jgi:DNA-binding transcriptional regulator YiaG